MWMYQLINIVLLLLVTFFFFSFKKNNYNQKDENVYYDFSNNYKFLIPFAILLILISGLRGQFSIDYSNYYHYFYQVKNLSFFEVLINGINTDRGFAIFCKIVSFFTQDCAVLMLVIASIIIFCYFKTFFEESKIVWLSILLLLTIGSYYTSFNTIRSFMVGAFTFFCGRFMYDKKMGIFIVLSLLIATFQKTAIVLIPSYFILTYDFSKINRKTLIILFLIGAVCYLYLDQLTHLAIDIFYPKYYESSFGLSSGRSLMTLVRPTGILIFLFLNRKYVDYSSMRDRVWINSTFLFALVSLFCTKIDILFRFYYFYLPFITLLIPNILVKLPKKQRNVWLLIIIIGCLGYSFITQYLGNEIYYFIWENKWFNY